MMLLQNFVIVILTYPKEAYFKDDRNFWAFFDLLLPSERKMTSLLLNTMMKCSVITACL